MSIALPRRGRTAGRSTLVYEFFDARVLGHLWFIAIADGATVQMLTPTFQSEQAARVFERCLLDYPSAFLLTIDSQLELARRIEDRIADLPAGDIASAGPPLENLLGGLAFEARPN